MQYIQKIRPLLEKSFRHKSRPIAGPLFLPQRWRRAVALRWLKRIHAWTGLWGALLGLLFGASGFLLNHRSVLKISAAETQSATILLGVPTQGFTDINAMSQWLRAELDLSSEPTRKRATPAKPVKWNNHELIEPEHWRVSYSTPQNSVSADYYRGQTSVTVRRRSANAFATINNMHKGAGASVTWVLLADTLAGGMIILSLTGTLLWTRLHGTRLLVAGMVSIVATMTLIYAFQSL